MKKKVVRGNKPLAKFAVIKDFLPETDELLAKGDKVKVTLKLNRSTVSYFEKLEEKAHTPYRKIIRNLLEHYASRAA